MSNYSTDQRLPIDRITRAAPEERFSEAEMAQIKRDVARRIKEAFGGDSNAEIARACLTTDAVIKAYIDGDRLPIAELLLQMHRKTGINLHWLLTGKGQKRIVREELFSDAEVDMIMKSAEKSGRSFTEQVRHLSLAAARMIEDIEK